ncbi:DNA polymerase III subunit alpha [Litoribrevibacter euphylliae]|uniref:DNA polymerase III subunit alpha n=1 Tax=Litoribrevibacter euphylliae TaxID=1834034 RepID=A0ABV7H948_9GAMM
MSSAPFVHLRVHSEYSLIDGIVKLKPLLSSSVEQKVPAVALTDQGNMFGLVKFYKGAQGSGIKPIMGSDVWLENEDEPDEPFRICLLSINEKGYRNLTEIISDAYLIGQRDEVPIAKKAWIEEKSEGLIMLSGGKDGDIGSALIKGKEALAQQRTEYWSSLFEGRFYLELHRCGRAGDEENLHGSVKLAQQLGLPVVATNDVRFIKQSDFEAHEARVCINQGFTLADPRRPKNYTEEQYLKTPEEMAELFSDIPSALQNTLEIAKRCSLEVKLGTYFLPEYPIPEGKTMDQFFREFSAEGLEERLEIILRDVDKDSEEYKERRKAYFDRLDFELDIILQMGFPGYFLIVMDFIQWAKDHDIPVGPGRGSGAGSLVAYAQKITDLDPLEYDLLFERFLNPERVSMPDFDIDFCMDNRDKVIKYVSENYGKEAVSQIVTFGTMAAKAVVRDVARVQGKSYGLADRLSKLIPPTPGMKLKDAIEEVAELKELIETDDDAQEIWEMALKLEGITRGTGKHAGGVVIAPTKLTDFSPVNCDPDGTGVVTQFDKGDVEEAGLVKFDFLGLRTLTIVDWALQTINAKRQKEGLEPVNIDLIPLDDQPSFDLLKRAETTAVFQLESRGMKDLIRRLQPDNIEDMIALVALFRPGPLESGMVQDFIDRKHGRAEVAYPHPDFQHESLKEILEPTYGVIVYQEQVMQIAQTLAGYTLGGADMLRRAMGKKKPEEMAKQRDTFREGAISQNVDPDLAMNIFDLVEKFAGYGFNKSHSAAYAIVSYQTLWLKTHYPAAFMAAVLSADMDKTDKVVISIEECREMKLDLVLPDINQAEFKFTVNDQDQVVYGLGAVKGVGEGPAEAILTARKDGPFKDLFDFCERVGAQKVNKRTLESLVCSGAFDKIGPNRAALIAAIPSAVKAADQSAKNEDAGMVDMFGELMAEDTERDVYEDYRELKEWSPKEKLSKEKDTLGLFLTGHPIEEYETEVKSIVTCRLKDLEPDRNKTYLIAGLVMDVRTMQSKKGDTIAFLALDDRTARIEVGLFGELYTYNKDWLKPDVLVVAETEVSYDNYSGGIRCRVKSLIDVERARSKYAKYVRVKLLNDKDTLQFNKFLNDGSLSFSEDGVPLLIDYQRPDARGRVRLGDDWKLAPDDTNVSALRSELGYEHVDILYRNSDI